MTSHVYAERNQEEVGLVVFTDEKNDVNMREWGLNRGKLRWKGKKM